jgi:hypothetical protein
MTHFYVYEHIRNDTGVCFYVGKGTKQRYTSNAGRSVHWHNIVNKVEIKHKIIADNLTEIEALNFEIAVIKAAKKAGINLCNLTDGGEGVSGYKHTQEAIKKISESKLDKIGEKHPHFKGVVFATNIKTNEIIELRGNRDMANKGFCYKHVNACVNGKRKTHKGYTFTRKNI